VPDLDFADILPSLSDPAELHDPGLSRRRFLQGLLAAGVVTTAVPSWMAGKAHAAANPLGAGEGVLVVAILGGGNDGLNTHAPISGPTRGRYEKLRSSLAIPAAALLPTGDDHGLHPSLPLLHNRYKKGQVAIVRGAGFPVTPLSHGEAMANMMAGSSNGSASTGWLGRYLDGVSDSRGGLRGLAVSPSVPLYLRGVDARITTVSETPSPEPGDVDSVAIRKVLRGYSAQPTGLGPLGDELATTARESLDRGGMLQPIYGGTLPAGGITRDLALAARLVNMNLGARVIGVTLDGFDTHLGQASTQVALFSALDAAIEGFFATLAPAYRNRTTLLAVSEFGRRAGKNSSGGTDHGAANLMLLAGDNVRGGLHAAESSLDQLDDRLNLKPTVDTRSVYASVLHRWLGADPKQVLGKAYPELDLFKAAPGG
jgi:uncharacterized protein (DUF1501 family)